MLQRPSGFVEPFLPSTAERPPSGPEWVHEIKQDGCRLMARRDPVGIRLLTRNGHDWSPRYPAIVEAVNHLKVRSCYSTARLWLATSAAWRCSIGSAIAVPMPACSCTPSISLS